MFALRLGDEPDSFSGGVQADAKIDILNRRGLIKSVRSPERIGTRDAQTSSECRRLKIAVSMDPVMAQVGVEPGKSPRARSVIIAAEGGCNLWSRLQSVHKPAQSLLVDGHIRIYEGEDLHRSGRERGQCSVAAKTIQSGLSRVLHFLGSQIDIPRSE
jgi:hypothetical protein